MKEILTFYDVDHKIHFKIRIQGNEVELDDRSFK